MVDDGSFLSSDERSRLSQGIVIIQDVFHAPDVPLTGKTAAVLHEIDTGDTRPIRCNLRRLSPQMIKTQDCLVDRMTDGHITCSDSRRGSRGGQGCHFPKA